jgi:hypothetical protein
MVGMVLRFYVDPDTGQPHIYKHGVTEQEAEEVMQGPGEDLRATAGGRYSQVFYVPDPDPGSAFVITAYEPQGKAMRAFRRRQRRKSK